MALRLLSNERTNRWAFPNFLQAIYILFVFSSIIQVHSPVNVFRSRSSHPNFKLSFSRSVTVEIHFCVLSNPPARPDVSFSSSSASLYRSSFVSSPQRPGLGVGLGLVGFEAYQSSAANLKISASFIQFLGSSYINSFYQGFLMKASCSNSSSLYFIESCFTIRTKLCHLRKDKATKALDGPKQIKMIPAKLGTILLSLPT